jgi:hypothetical protein
MRREYWVGTSTALTLLANAVMPGVLDRYLAKTGFKSQQTDQPQSPGAPANLWEPADGAGGSDFGAHGEFDAKAHRTDPQLWASQHHGALTAAAGALVAVAGSMLARRR